MANELENVLYVYDKNMNLLALFDGNTEGASEETLQNMVVAPTIKQVLNGESTLSFQILANSTKWTQIKDPENLYYINGKYYTILNNGSVTYTGEGSIRIANVVAVETWYLLDRQYTQIYDCGLYTYAKATFQSFTADGAIFRITSSGCSNPGETITTANAWSQVKLWRPKDNDGNQLIYSILKGENYAPTNWENAPAAVAFSAFSVSGNTATVTIKSRVKSEIQQNFEYNSNNIYVLNETPYPNSLKEVYVNSTIVTTTGNTRKYTTSNKSVNYHYSNANGNLSLRYTPVTDETINYIIVVYEKSELGTISPGATCTFAFGAEVIDEHTVLVLPKADSRYKLTIDGVEYDDSQVRDSRGVIMPRGSAGYAMWAVLKNSGWKLGICDVIAKDFNASIDYGCFNIESDQKDVLYNIQYIQQLYGGVLVWDSKNKILNYRAENSTDYQAYNDGFNSWTGYEFREGKNMKDQPQIVYDNTIITRAYLLGYSGLNVKKVNGGKTYIDDFSYTKDLYEGYLEQPLIYDTNDEGGMKQLLYWGRKELAKKCKPRKTITINANDIRTVDKSGISYNHEIFDMYNVVRVWSRESDTDVETYEEKRIIEWEYNAFALWDSTVVLGDKTQNFSELFKLIYNKAVVDAPQPNATGKISSDEVVMEFEVSDFSLDLGGIDYSSYGYGSDGYSIGGYGYGSTLSDYLSLIVQKTTDNSNAIAGLTMEATDLYAQAELFASYRKQTDDMLSETYSGLKVYADEKGSEAKLVAEGYYKLSGDALNKAIKETDSKIKEVVSDIDYIETRCESGFYAKQWWNGAMATQYAKLEGTVKANDSAIDYIRYTQYAGLESRVILGESSINNLTASFEQNVYNKNGTALLQKSVANLEQFAGPNYASQTLTSRFEQWDKTNAQKFVSEAKMEQFAGKNYASQTLSTRFKDAETSIKQYVANNYASINLQVTADKLQSAVVVSNSYTSIVATGNRSSFIRVDSSGSITLSPSAALTLAGKIISLGTSSSSLSIKGYTVSWKQIYAYSSSTSVTKTSFYVLSR